MWTGKRGQTPDCEGLRRAEWGQWVWFWAPRELLASLVLVITVPEGWPLERLKEGAGDGQG